MNEKLRLARINKHLSEREVCRSLGADLRTYQHWEGGKHLPQPYYRQKLCTFFGLTLEELGFDPQILLFAYTGASVPPAASRVRDITPETEPLALPTDLLAIALLALKISQQERGWSQDQMQEYVMSQMSQPQQPGAITRRDFGLLLAGLPLAGLALTEVPEELFPHCSANLTTAWKLASGSDLSFAQSIVQAYIPALLPLAERSSRSQQIAAELLAKFFMLNGLIEMHLVHLSAREKSCQQAVKYAEISGNVDLMVAARRWLAHTYYYLNNSVRAMEEYQQATRYLSQVTPLAKSNVLAHFAIVQAQQQQSREALNSMSQAQDLFFGEANGDQGTIYTGHDASALMLNAANTYYMLGDYQKSMEKLSQVDSLQPKQFPSERTRLEWLSRQALVAAKLNDLEQATTYLEAATVGAKELGSKLRFAEAQKIYHALEFLWPNEAKLAELRPLFAKHLS